jgi:20S proteasome alpha/beta subunit
MANMKTKKDDSRDIRKTESMIGGSKSSKRELGMQSVVHGIDKNPNVTAADPKAKFIARAKAASGGIVLKGKKVGCQIK